jgi:23S rRNA (guanosine2251-2'-O)-methyltransferase
MATELLYGRNAVRESLLAGRRRHQRLVVASGTERTERVGEIVKLARERDLPVDIRPRAELDEHVDAAHQGVVLETGAYPYADGHDLPSTPNQRDLLLALDGLEDARNVGSLLRCAEATGVSLVVIPTDRAASITPAVANASAGAVEHLRTARETNLVRWLERAKEAGYWIAGLETGPEAQSLFEADIPMPAVLVVGSEGRGMRRLTREHCDILLSIPMYGRIESLNVAIAGSVALYEMREFPNVS